MESKNQSDVAGTVIEEASEPENITNTFVIRVKMIEVIGLSVSAEINIPIAIRAAPTSIAPSQAFKKISQFGEESNVTIISKSTTGENANA